MKAGGVLAIVLALVVQLALPVSRLQAALAMGDLLFDATICSSQSSEAPESGTPGVFHSEMEHCPACQILQLAGHVPVPTLVIAIKRIAADFLIRWNVATNLTADLPQSNPTARSPPLPV